MQIKLFNLLLVTICFIGLMQKVSWACACGCGIFDVGTSSMFPSGKGGTVFLDYDFMDQNHNWSKNFKASNDDNSDKKIRTSFINTGVQYMFNRRLGVQIELPYDHRYFKTIKEIGTPYRLLMTRLVICAFVVFIPVFHRICRQV